MPSPLKLSLDDVRREAREEVAFLEDLIAKRPDWRWPRELLVLSQEFETLVLDDSATLARAHDFASRLQLHIRQKHLKGMEPAIWRAQAFEDIVRDAKKG